MLIKEGVEGLHIDRAVVTTGNFDGVHLGHQFLLKELVRIAKESSMTSVVVVFYPHPRIVLGTNVSDLSYLSTQAEKCHYFEKLGVDMVVQILFDLDMAQWSAQDFMQKILIDKINMKHFLLGYDHRLGNPKYETNILKIARELPIKVQEYSPFKLEEEFVSSSQIREALKMGNVTFASEMLGRYYNFRCVVVEGAKLGRSIGYPTANLIVVEEQRQIPKDGVYAVKIKIVNSYLEGMLAIGGRPTLNDGRGQTIEVHIFDYNSDIYHQEVEICFVQYLRQNIRFESVEGLKKQLKKDEDIARDILRKVSEK